MNKNQKIVLWLGIAAFVLMGLFPPIQRTTRRYPSYSMNSSGFRTRYRGSGYQHKTIEYRFVMDTTNGTVVLSNLFVQWFIVSIITAGLIYTFKDKKDKKPKAEQKQQVIRSRH